MIMKTTFLTLTCAITLLGIPFLATGQKNSYLIDLKIQKIIYHGDSVVFDSPAPFEIKTSKTSDIIEIGHLHDEHFGVQFEILKSDLEHKEAFITARVYYIKRGASNWEKLVRFDHNEVKVNRLSQRKSIDKELEERIKAAGNDELRKLFMQASSDASGDPPIFAIYYRINYYR